MTRSGWMTMLMGLVSGSVTGPAFAQDACARTPTVDAFATAFVDAVRAYDVDAWSCLVSEDVIMMTPAGRVVEGRDAFRATWTRTFDGATGTNPLQVRVRGTEASGDLVVVRAAYGPEDAAPVGYYVWLLKRSTESGDLRLSWWIFNRG